jgi:hypothetical protein
MEVQIGSQKKPIWANSIEEHTYGGDAHHGGLGYNFGGELYQPARATHAALGPEIPSPQYPEEWLIGSRASAHVIGNKNLFIEIRAVPHSSVTTVGGNSLPIVGQGHAALDKNKGVSTVIYVHGMQKNLLSVGKFVDEGHYTHFGPKRCWIFDNYDPHKVLLTGTYDYGNSLYRLDTSLQDRSSSLQRRSPTVSPKFNFHLAMLDNLSPAELWHHWIAHLNYQYLYNLFHRNMVKGLSQLPHVQPTYKACILGKQHCSPIPKASQTPTTRLLQLVYSDLCGPLPQKSLLGSKYILTFIDDFSHYS